MPEDLAASYLGGAQLGTQQANNAAQWAYQSADLSMKKQYLQQAQEQHDQQKLLFESQLGKMQLDDVFHGARMSEGPAKKAYLSSRKDYWEKAGHPVADSLWAATSDPAYQLKFSKLADFVNSGDPQGLQTYLQGVVNTTSDDKEWMDGLDKSLAAFATKQKAQGFADPKLQSQANQAGAEFNNNTTMKLLDTQKSALSHVRNLLEQANKGERKKDLNLYHEINNTLVNATTQSNNPALGRQERTEWVPYESGILNTFNKFTDKDFESASAVGWKKLEQTFDAIESAVGDFQKDKAVRIARAHLGTVAGNPYMEQTLSSGLGSYGLTLDDARNYKPKPRQAMTPGSPQPPQTPQSPTLPTASSKTRTGDEIRQATVLEARSIYRQLQRGEIKDASGKLITLDEVGKKKVEARYKKTYSQDIRDEAEKGDK